MKIFEKLNIRTHHGKIFMMILFVSIIMITIQKGYSQKAELKQLCRAMDSIYKTTKPIHIVYNVSVMAKEDYDHEEGNVEIFKYKDSFLMKVGGMQDVACKKNISVIANHKIHSLIVQVDTVNMKYETGLIDVLTVLVDSAFNIIKTEDSGKLKFKIVYKNQMYTELDLVFDKKNGHLLSSYALYNNSFQQPFYSVKVEYTLWDKKWRPKKGFPFLNEYFVNESGKYQPVGQYKTYEFFINDSTNKL